MAPETSACLTAKVPPKPQHSASRSWTSTSTLSSWATSDWMRSATPISRRAEQEVWIAILVGVAQVVESQVQNVDQELGQFVGAPGNVQRPLLVRLAGEQFRPVVLDHPGAGTGWNHHRDITLKQASWARATASASSR